MERLEAELLADAGFYESPWQDDANAVAEHMAQLRALAIVLNAFVPPSEWMELKCARRPASR
jgi:hypothetical protein